MEKIVLIGSGNVATMLADVFIEKGLQIAQVYSHSLEHAEALAKAINCEGISDLNKLRKDADLYVIAVKDDAIAEVAANLRLPGKTVVHTSGSIALDTIKNISEKTGVFYPLQSFTKGRKLDWQNIPIIIESNDNGTVITLKNLGERVAGSVYEINSENRKKLHLAAVFANNFINYLLGEAKEILGENIPFTILQPLVNETVSKAFDLGIEASQTGPAKRGDLKTIEAHLAILKTHPGAEILYKMITAAIAKKYNSNQA